MTSLRLPAAFLLASACLITAATAGGPVRGYVSLDGPPTCEDGYVWREAGPGDYVCVTPQRRSAVQSENSRHASLINPNGGNDPNTCKDGFVWRGAFAGDNICVKPNSRDAAARENAQNDSHTK